MRQLACVLITLLFGLGSCQKYEVTERMRLATEYRNMADSDLLREYANLLLSGPENERKLIAIAAGGEGKQKRAAALVLLYSGDPKFVPTLIALADDKELSGIASEAVSINPEASWKAVIRLARSGSAGATALVHRYVNLRDDAFDELIKSTGGTVRFVKPKRDSETSKPQTNMAVVRADGLRVFTSSESSPKTFPPSPHPPTASDRR